MSDQAAVLRHPLVRMLLELGESDSERGLQVQVSQSAPVHAPIAEAHRSTWPSSCRCECTGCAQDDGADSVAKRFQQFLDANGKTLQQQGAADADLNAVLDYFAANRASASSPGNATAAADTCSTGASLQPIA